MAAIRSGEDPGDAATKTILGSTDTFFASVFSAQGKRQLSSYRNGEIKSLLVDLLGLESVRRRGAFAAETARLLKSGLALLRSEQAQSEAALNALRRERGSLQSAASDLQSALQPRAAASEALAAAQVQLAQARAEALSAGATEARRRDLRDERDAAAKDERAAEQRLTAIDLDPLCAQMCAAQLLVNLFVHRRSIGELVVYQGNALGPSEGLSMIVHMTFKDLSAHLVLPALHPSRLAALRDAARYVPTPTHEPLAGAEVPEGEASTPRTKAPAKAAPATQRARAAGRSLRRLRPWPEGVGLEHG